MVICPQMGTPYVQHPTYEKACAEAQRLSKKATEKTFFVLQVVQAFHSTVHTESANPENRDEVVEALELAEKELRQPTGGLVCDDENVFARNFPYQYAAWKKIRAALDFAKGGAQ
jgi:hypothetical protein